MFRAVPCASGQKIGEPEKPGPMPVASTAGPETSIRIRAPPPVAPPSTTSSTWTAKALMSVPRTTE